jgi:hypothetical protein
VGRAERLPDTAAADVLFAVIGRLPGAPVAAPAAGAARAAPLPAFPEAGTPPLSGDADGAGLEPESGAALHWHYRLALSVSALGSLTLYRRRRAHGGGVG